MGATRINTFKQFDAVPVSSTNVYTSTVSNVGQMHNLGFQVIFTGTMTGTLQILFSNDNVNFTPWTFSPALSQPAGSALSYLVNMSLMSFPYVRVKYTNASGSGTMSVSMTSKDLS
jgi:hypothetical protein